MGSSTGPGLVGEESTSPQTHSLQLDAEALALAATHVAEAMVALHPAETRCLGEVVRNVLGHGRGSACLWRAAQPVARATQNKKNEE